MEVSRPASKAVGRYDLVLLKTKLYGLGQVVFFLLAADYQRVLPHHSLQLTVA